MLGMTEKVWPDQSQVDFMLNSLPRSGQLKNKIGSFRRIRRKTSINSRWPLFQ